VLLLLPFELCVAAVAAIMLANTIHTNKHMHMKGVVGGGGVAVQRGLEKGGGAVRAAESGALIRNVVSGHSYAEHNCIQSERRDGPAECRPMIGFEDEAWALAG